MTEQNCRTCGHYELYKMITYGMEKDEMIGLMGVQNDGKTLVTPNGNVLFAVPSWLARWIQHIQHWIAKSTWK